MFLAVLCTIYSYAALFNKTMTKKVHQLHALSIANDNL